MIKIDKKKAADNIKNLRERLDLNQTEFAKQIGVKQPLVSMWEKGERFASFQKCYRMMYIASLKNINIKINYFRPLIKSKSD